MVLARQVKMRVPAIRPTNGAGMDRIPAAPDPAAHRRYADAVLHCDVTLSPTIWKKAPPSVPCLLAARCPPAVARFVVSVHVDTIDGEVCGVPASTSLIAEALELRPFNAYGDSSATVVVPSDSVRVRAASLHARPDAKEPGQALSMDRGLDRAEVPAEAPARGCLPLAQPIPSNDTFGATRTSAAPRDIRLHAPFTLDDSQSPEHSASQVNHGASSHESSLLCNPKGWA